MAKSKMLTIWDRMEKIYGNNGSCKLGPVQTMCSTGSLALDEAIGIWGLPKGRVIQYAGKKSSGKTLMSLVAIREWQQKNPDNWAIFVDAEETFNEVWAAKLGVDLNRLFMIETNDGIEIWTQLCGVPSREIGKPKTQPGILDLEKENPSGLGLIVLDSIASVTTPVEMTKVVGNTNIAPAARFMPDALRRLVPLLAQSGVTLIAINQVRVDVGKMWGDPETTPGGKAWDHALSLMVHFTMSESKKTHFIDEGVGRIGHVAGVRIDKNKVACPGATCNFEVKYLEGVINRHKEIGELGIKYNIIDRPNNRTYVYGDYKWLSRNDFLDALTDEGLASEILDKVKQAKESGVSPKNSDDDNIVPEIDPEEEE